MVWLLSLIQNTFPSPSSVEETGDSGLANMAPGWWQPLPALPSAPDPSLQHHRTVRRLCGRLSSLTTKGRERGLALQPIFVCNITRIPTRPLGGWLSALERIGGGGVCNGRRGTGTLRSPLPMSSRERPQLVLELGLKGFPAQGQFPNSWELM